MDSGGPCALISDTAQLWTPDDSSHCRYLPTEKEELRAQQPSLRVRLDWDHPRLPSTHYCANFSVPLNLCGHARKYAGSGKDDIRIGWLLGCRLQLAPGCDATSVASCSSCTGATRRWGCALISVAISSRFYTMVRQKDPFSDVRSFLPIHSACECAASCGSFSDNMCAKVGRRAAT